MHANQYTISVCTVVGDTPDMGKKSKSPKSSGAKSSSFASRRLPDLNPVVARVLRVSALTTLANRLRARQRLREIEDRRTYHPSGKQRSARSFNKSHHALVVKKSPRSSRGVLSSKVSFKAPRKVLVCVRREARREVIFAKKKYGRGVRRRNPRRSWFSDVSCKR